METVLLRRLPKKGYLLNEITTACVKAGVQSGSISLIGALSNGVLYCYNQETLHYEAYDLPKHCEIVSCTGNISERDGKTFVHAHVIVSDAQGRCMGGHLMADTCEIFAAELTIFIGTHSEEVPIRGLDEATQLPLWINR